VHDDAISPEQRRALLALKPAADRGFYLAGGSALCLRSGRSGLRPNESDPVPAELT
jgi:hypothetical protein